ncbi:hypothetical protein AVEN_268972-1 [Araneus ventricosus]|uniref:Uncharacterized protein n=1 Tax=Araneus ventricosus TaxID=182803 RepID=A0A4Y2I2C7_ARAVE|nr:hypothetical protein AVEN_268972-1 [Araneus ventricosus]
MLNGERRALVKRDIHNPEPLENFNMSQLKKRTCLAVELDKSSNRSRVPSSMVLIGSGQLLTGGLCRLHAGGLLKRYRTPGPL